MINVKRMYLPPIRLIGLYLEKGAHIKVLRLENSFGIQIEKKSIHEFEYKLPKNKRERLHLSSGTKTDEYTYII